MTELQVGMEFMYCFIIFYNSDYMTIYLFTGRIAALNMVGKPTEVKSVPFFWTVQFGKSIRYTGFGLGYDDIVIHGDLDELKFIAYYTK